MPLVEGGSQLPARRQILLQEQPMARLPRLKGLQSRSRLTKNHEMYPVQGLLGGDVLFPMPLGEEALSDLQIEMLAHLALVEGALGAPPGRVRAPERSPVAADD